MKFVTWTVQIKIEESWVRDGFEITPERLGAAINRDLGGAYNDEIQVKVLKAPRKEKILKIQGYTKGEIAVLTKKEK